MGPPHFAHTDSEIIEADAKAIEHARVALHGRLGELWLADKKVDTIKDVVSPVQPAHQTAA